MKTTPILASIVSLLLTTTLSVTAQNLTSGSIAYEAMQKIDPSQMKIMINGQEIKPGSPEAPPDLPDVRTFSQQLVFSGQFAKVEQDEAAPMIRKLEGPPGGGTTGGIGGGTAPQPMKLEPPFIQRKYVDLASQQYIQVLEIKREGVTKTYQAEEPFRKTANWKETGQTKKIAGYNCHKATCPWKGENYTIWYTTDLNFTYSPINGLTPEKGVVLQLEGSGESFKATKVQAKTVAESEVKPGSQAEKVTPEQLTEIREKAMATFRQHMFEADGR